MGIAGQSRACGRVAAGRTGGPARLALALLLAAFGHAWAADLARPAGPSGLPLPRFVALDADEVNLRTGPGTRYPIAWVFVREGLPVEVVGEFGLWRRIRDFDGVEGWAHKSLLTGRRTALVVGEVRTLRREPDESSPPVLYAEPMVQGRLLACRPAWCRLRIAGLEGWIRRAFIWGVFPDETFE